MKKLLSFIIVLFFIVNLFAQESKIPSHAEKTINFSTSGNVPVVKAAKTATFNDGDIIFSMTNFGGPIQKQFRSLIPTLVIWLDGDLLFIKPLPSLMTSQKTSIKVQLFPDASTWDGQMSLAILNNALSMLTPGDHKLVVGWTASGGYKYKDMGWYGEITLKADDLKKWGATARKINAANLAKVKLPKAITKDPKLEAKMIALTNAFAKEHGWKQKYSKAVIRTNWSTMRNSLTGIIIGRKRVAALCATFPDGHCIYQTVWFTQGHNGSSYSSTLKFDGFGEEQEIMCEKIK